MRLFVVLAACGFAAAPALPAETVTVRCDQGQAIGSVLARLDSRRPSKLRVRGTCTERVEIRGFDSLTVQGEPGATIAEPPGGDASPPLKVFASTGLVVRGLTITGRVQSALIAGCHDCSVERSTLQGVVVLGGPNSVLFSNDAFHANGGFAALAAYGSGCTVVDSTLDPGNGSPWWGVVSDKGASVGLSGTSVRGFGIGVGLSSDSMLSVAPTQLAGSAPDQTVVIADNWFRGIDASASTVYLSPIARLENNGEIGRAGVLLSNGSHLDAIGGVRIVGSNGNGLVVVNSSTATAHPDFPDVGVRVEISGSLAQDVFCDATSVVSGTSQLTGVTKVTCPNQNSDETVPLP